MDCGWIDVKVRLPEHDMYVLVTNAKWGPEFYEGEYHKDKNIFETCNMALDVTHWLPIPNPPNQG